MSSHWRWRFGFSGNDGLVDDHTSKHESRACGMLSGCVISEIKNWLAEMEANYAGSAKSEARCKPMPLSLMGRFAWIQPISSNETLQISVAQDFRQSSKSGRRSGCWNVGELRCRYISLGIEKLFFRRKKDGCRSKKWEFFSHRFENGKFVLKLRTDGCWGKWWTKKYDIHLLNKADILQDRIYALDFADKYSFIRPRLTNYDLDGLRKRPMSASIHEHLLMSSQTDLGSPVIVASSKYKALKLDFMEDAMSG